MLREMERIDFTAALPAQLRAILEKPHWRYHMAHHIARTMRRDFSCLPEPTGPKDSATPESAGRHAMQLAEVRSRNGNRIAMLKFAVEILKRGDPHVPEADRQRRSAGDFHLAQEIADFAIAEFGVHAWRRATCNIAGAIPPETTTTNRPADAGARE